MVSEEPDKESMESEELGKEPTRFYIEKSDKKDYDRLLERDSPLRGKDNKELFILAMTVGFREGQRMSLSKKEGYFMTSYLNEEEKSIIKALAVAEEGDLGVLINKKKVHTIAEEYANGGIKLLKDKVFSGEYGSYAKKLEAELVEIFEEKIKKDLHSE